MTNRILLVGIALALGTSALGIPVLPTAEAADGVTPVPCSDPRGCPDLVVDPDTMNPSIHVKEYKANNCDVVEGMTQPGVRTLLRFTFTTPNFGAGDLIIGNPHDHPEWFEAASCHGHFHFRQYADYRLWTPSQFQQYEAIRTANPDLTAAEVIEGNSGLNPVRGDKRGFCVIDIVLYTPPNPPKYTLCGSQLLDGFQGISVGWADEYDSDLDGQFIDVTGLPSGSYVLEAEVNAERLYTESAYSNNRAATPVTI